jgi:hypothetical protein
VVTVPPPERRPAPFAIGVIVMPRESLEGVGGRPTVTDRLAVALAAWRAGYFLLDTIEVDAEEPVDGPGWARVWELAAATEPDRLFARGVDVAELEPMASELRLLVRRVDEDAVTEAML